MSGVQGLYILLGGRLPFWGKTKSQIFDAVRAADLHFWSDPRDNISDSAKKLIREMLCTDPSQRLTAHQVLDHAWTKDLTVLSEVPFVNERQSFGGLDAGGDSFPASFMTRNEDISFGTAAPVIFNSKSPAQTCKSPLLSNFIVDPSMLLSESGGFSFHSSSGGSNTLEFSTAVLSMPSFAFFSPDPVFEQGNYEMEFSANIC